MSDGRRIIRKIESTQSLITTASGLRLDFTGEALKKWLAEQARPLSHAVNGVPLDVYLLAHHDDGVVWGKLKENGQNNELITSDVLPCSPSPPFCIATLQEYRLFSQRGELHVWRSAEKEFARCLLRDAVSADVKEADVPVGSDEGSIHRWEYFDEPQVLWGTQRDEMASTDNFTVVYEGQGLCHAFPQKVEGAIFEKERRPLRLIIRHYLDEDSDGCVRIALSRLVDLQVV